MEFIYDNDTDWNQLLVDAANNNEIDIVKYAITKGATDYNKALSVACDEYNHDIIKLMVDKGATNLNESLYEIALRKATDEDLDCIKYLIKAGANNFDNIMINACVTNSVNVIEYLSTLYNYNWNEYMSCVCSYNSVDALRYILKKGANDVYYGIDGYDSDENKSKNIEILKILIEHGLDIAFDYSCGVFGVYIDDRNVKDLLHAGLDFAYLKKHPRYAELLNISVKRREIVDEVFALILIPGITSIIKSYNI